MNRARCRRPHPPLADSRRPLTGVEVRKTIAAYKARRERLELLPGLRILPIRVESAHRAARGRAGTERRCQRLQAESGAIAAPNRSDAAARPQFERPTITTDSATKPRRPRCSRPRCRHTRASGTRRPVRSARRYQQRLPTDCDNAEAECVGRFGTSPHARAGVRSAARDHVPESGHENEREIYERVAI